MWESRVRREISKALWKSVCDFHRGGISIAAASPECSVSADPPAVPRRRKPPGLAIDPAEFHVHEPCSPIALLGFRQPDEFPAHRLADKDHVALPPDLAIRFDPPHLMRSVVPRVLEPRRVGPR